MKDAYVSGLFMLCTYVEKLFTKNHEIYAFGFNNYVLCGYLIYPSNNKGFL